LCLSKRKTKKERTLKKQTIQTERHHRRSVSLGGSDYPANISWVPPELHRAWHVLNGDMNAKQICNKINSLPQKPEGVTVVCKFINGTPVALRGGHNSKSQAKCENAEDILFKGLTFQQRIDYTNNTWLDPSYHLYCIYKK